MVVVGRRVLLFLVVGLILVSAACGKKAPPAASSVSTPVTTPSPSPSPSVIPSETDPPLGNQLSRDEKRFLTSLRKDGILRQFFSDDEAINVGKDICRTYRTGGSIPLEDIEVAFDAIKYFCPQFEDLIQVFP